LGDEHPYPVELVVIVVFHRLGSRKSMQIPRFGGPGQKKKCPFSAAGLHEDREIWRPWAEIWTVAQSPITIQYFNVFRCIKI